MGRKWSCQQGDINSFGHFLLIYHYYCDTVAFDVVTHAVCTFMAYYMTFMSIVLPKTWCRHLIVQIFHRHGIYDLWPHSTETQQQTDGFLFHLITMFRLELAAALHQLCSQAASEAGMYYAQRGGRIHDS